jgi:hypothetical protein
VVATDMFSTVAQLAGADTSGMTDSFPITPFLSRTGASNGRQFAFTELCPPSRPPGSGDMYTVVSRDNHKLSYNRGNWEFFDLNTDPSEAHNLYSEEKPGAQQAAMKAEIAALAARPDNVKGCFH